MDSEQLASMFRTFVQLSKSVPKSLLRDLHKSVEIMKAYLKLKATRLIQANDSTPVLLHFQADGTEKKMKKAVSLVGAEDAVFDCEADRVHRSGTETVEIMSQIAFVKTLDSKGEFQIAVLMSDPKPMLNGKSQWFLHSAFTAFLPLLCKVHPGGISISAYVFDRAVFSSSASRMYQRHFLHHNPLEAAGSTTELENLSQRILSESELLDWVEPVACCNHDVQNAFKWGVISPLEEPEATLNDLFIGVESVRNSFSYVLKHLRAWLATVLVFKHKTDNVADVSSYWSAMGVSERWMPLFELLDPVWDGKNLVVAATEQHNVATWERLPRILLYIFKFVKMKDSRWVCLAGGCATLLASWGLGLDAFVKFIRKMPGSGGPWIHGYDNLAGTAVRGLTLVAALSGSVSDAALAFLLTDDRLGSNVEHFVDTVKAEVLNLDSLPELVWVRVAQAAGGSLTSFTARSTVMRSALVACAFMEHRFILKFLGLPWSLARGDIDQNIKALARQVEEPTDSTTYKNWVLARSG